MRASILGEARFAWSLLAILLAISLIGAHPLMMAVAAAGVTLGFLVLFLSATANKSEAAIRVALNDTAIRITTMVLAVFIALIGIVFSIEMALFVTVWYLASALLLSALASNVQLKNYVKNTTLFAAASCFVFGIAEAVLHLPQLEWTFGTPAERAKWDTRYDRMERKNVFGIRSPYETVARKPNSIRVISIGDSFTWGEVVAGAEDLWPAILEEKLKRHHGDKTVEVINMARPGFTTTQEAERLRRFGWQFSPDLVLVQFLVNDAIVSYPNFGVDKIRGEWLYPQYKLLPLRFRTGLVKHSALFYVIESRYSAIRGGPVIPRYLQLFEENEPGWVQTKASFREMAEEAKRRNVPIVLMLFPMFEPGYWSVETYPLAELHRKVALAAEQAGMRTFDLLPVFAKTTSDWKDYWATPYDAHPSPEAHKLAATALADYLVGTEWYENALDIKNLD